MISWECDEAPVLDNSHATLVAYYASKPDQLAKLITRVQAMAASVLHDKFLPRRACDVHATIVGLERVTRIRDGRSVTRDARSLAAHVAATLTPSWRIQFGGFPKSFTVMTSAGRSLYERSCGWRGENLVLIGWPVDESGMPGQDLAILRHGAENFGFMHRHHSTPEDMDPDLYLVLGAVSAGATAVELRQSEQAMRDWLAAQSTIAELGAADVSLARYVSTELPHETTEHWGLSAVADHHGEPKCT